MEGEHLFLVSATDGLWEFISSQEVADIVVQHSASDEVVSELIKEAKKRWLQEEEVIDDTTVCVAYVGEWRGGRGAGTAGAASE